jgi:hypothetical protein
VIQPDSVKGFESWETPETMPVAKSHLLHYVVATIFVGLIIELTAYLAIQFILFPREPAFFFRSPSVSAPEFDRYVTVRDSLLGWPAKKTDMNGTEVIESRPIPAYSSTENECVSLYGDSFTYGDEVEHAEAWSNVLSSRLNCRVGNYGIGGYGTDQAYLRFDKNVHDSAKVVILGIFPENVLRNVNRYRYLLDARTVFSLKPRFILENDRLKLVEIPVWNREEFVVATQSLDKVFEHETFLPDSEYGPVSLSFPYAWKAVKLLLSERARSAMLGHTSWEVFYRDDHPTQALRITSEIADLFMKTGRSRGKTALVLIYPTARSFKQFKETGTVITRPLIENLERRRIPYLDLHEGFGKRVEKQEFCDLLTQPATCAGHFNAKGNVMVSDIVYEHLVKSNFLEMRSTGSSAG